MVGYLSLKQAMEVRLLLPELLDSGAVAVGSDAWL